MLNDRLLHFVFQLRLANHRCAPGLPFWALSNVSLRVEYLLLDLDYICCRTSGLQGHRFDVLNGVHAAHYEDA